MLDGWDVGWLGCWMVGLVELLDGWVGKVVRS